jgi:Cdc6-like AAA superfamily ATPase
METLKFKSEKLVGRTKEINQMQSALEGLQQGHSKTVFVSDEAGIGKTRLMNETIQTRLRENDMKKLGVKKGDYINVEKHRKISDATKEEIKRFGKKLNLKGKIIKVRDLMFRWES